MKSDLVLRMEATDATLAKFRGQPFDWAAGMHCAKLLHFHLGRMKRPRPDLPRLRSIGQAKRALVERKARTMADVMDQLGFEPIAPAQMLIGDVAYKSSPDGLGGIMICAGPLQLFGWFAENPETEGKLCVGAVDLNEVERAWRL